MQPISDFAHLAAGETCQHASNIHCLTPTLSAGNFKASDGDDMSLRDNRMYLVQQSCPG